MNAIWGLLNLGNTCFCNATLQALWHTPLLRKILAIHGNDSSCNGILANSHGTNSSCHKANGIKKGMKIANQLANCSSQCTKYSNSYS